jgi:RHS repeat-associated protein
VDYDYDILNRLSEVKDNRLSGSQNTSYSYDAVGNLQSYSYPNQVTTSYAYNNLNRLTTLSVANGQTNLASYAYTLGSSGNRTAVTENTGRTVNYVYDDLYRLTSETIANSANNGSISYSFDAVGNRLQRNSSVNLVASQSSTYDANDRLNSDVYDNNGSTKVSNGKSYNYDFENKLTSTSDGITVVYDGDGNRVSKTVNGITTKYLVDTNNLTGYAQVVEELVSGQVTKQYTYGLDLISQRQNSSVSFYNYDGHGSVRGLSNTSGSVTDTYTYDAFGTLIERIGTTSNSYLYAGEQFDSDLGFYYNRARYLNVETGRFISQDTYEGDQFEPKSLHKYTYAENDGVNKIDPSGNFTLTEAAIVVGVISVIAAIFYGIYYIKNLKTPIRASWKWENTWESIDGKGLLNESEILTVKQTAYATFKEAFSGFNVNSIEGGGGDREIYVSKQLGDGVGATYPISKSSIVYYPNMRFTLNEVVKSNNLSKTRFEMIEALGKGLGATAAHEIGHQYGLEFISHQPAQGFYNTKELNSTSVDHFFGKLKWSPDTFEKMNSLLSKAE